MHQHRPLATKSPRAARPTLSRRSAWMLVGGTTLLLIAAGFAADYWYGLPDDAQATYVGRQSCIQCHQGQAKRWEHSHHDLAMDLATSETVLADFQDQKLEHHGQTSKMFRRGGKYFVHTDGPDGKLADFEVKYVFGVQPLQQYLIELPRGRLQAFSIAWDTRPKSANGQRWFHLRAGERVTHTDELHWTQPSQNWNYMCADCHSTALRKNYDASSDQFRTSWSEVSVGCEACHGPGSRHVAW